MASPLRMIRLHPYPSEPSSDLARCAESLGIELRQGLRVGVATDGQVPLLAGHAAASVMSVEAAGVPRHYHWPTDTADQVEWATVADAVDLLQALVRRLDGGPRT